MPTPEPVVGVTKAQRWLGLFELVLLVGFGAFAWIFHVTLPSKLPTTESNGAVAQVLESERQPGDAVVLFPWWTERARLFLPEGLPVHGWLHVESEDFLSHPRLWVLAQPELPRSDWEAFEKAFAPGRTQRGDTRRFGTYELRLYENGRHRPELFKATERIAEARVSILVQSAERTCSFDGRRHVCGPSLTVAPEWHELFYAPRKCLTMHPPGGSTRLAAEFPPAPMGEELLLEAGIIWEYAFQKSAELTPVQVVVEDASNGRRLTELRIVPGVEGMQKVTLPTGATAFPSPVPLRVWVQSDNPKARELCVELRTLGAAGSAR